MILGSVGSFVSSVGSSALGATASVVRGVATVVEAHPLVAAAIIGYEVYTHRNGSTSTSSGSSSSVGGNVDTHA